MKNCVLFYQNPWLFCFIDSSSWVRVEIGYVDCTCPFIWTVTMCSYEWIFSTKNHCALFYLYPCKSVLLFWLSQTRVLCNPKVKNLSNLIQNLFSKKLPVQSLWKVLWNSKCMILLQCPFHQKLQTIACSVTYPKNVNATFRKNADPAKGTSCCENGLKHQ